MKSPGLLETLPGHRVFVLAHQGGWDEILLIVGPLAVVALLLWLANRRVTAQLDGEPNRGDQDGGTSPQRDQGSTPQ